MPIKNKKTAVLACIYGGILSLSGCASITSEVICGEAEETHRLIAKIGSEVDACNKSKKIGDGIVYYLPKRDIRIDITVAKSDSGGSGTSSPSTINLTVPSDSPQNISATISPGAKSDTSKPEQKTSSNKKKEDSKPNDKKSDTPPNADTKKVTITIPNNRDTETLPDLENVFLLRYNKNWIGDNNMAVGVSPLGLLTVTHADSINKINDIAANIAIDAAAISMGAGALLKTSDTARATALPTASITAPTFTPSGYTATFNEVEITDSSCKEGAYSILINPVDKKSLSQQICGLSIDIQTVFATALQNGNSNWIDPGDWTTFDGFYDHSRILARNIRNLSGFFTTDQYRLNSLPGIFYKQDIPYNVKIRRGSDKIGTTFLAFSPNESKVYFAPVTETIFTDNTSDVTLVNGVVNTLKENTDSELLGLSKIPANVLGAYTNASGEIFSALGTVAKNQDSLQTNELSVLLNAQKITRCQMAIASNNLAGKTGDDLTKAYSAIQSACN